MNPGSMVDGKNAQSRPRPWQLRLTCDTRGVPVDEEVLWQGDWQLGEMEIADFGTLIFQFLRLPHLTPRIDRCGLVLWPLLDNEDYPKDSASLVAIQEEQAGCGSLSRPILVGIPKTSFCPRTHQGRGSSLMQREVLPMSGISREGLRESGRGSGLTRQPL